MAAPGIGVGTEIIPALPYLPFPNCPKAGEIVNAVRDLAPDPVYDDAGTPLPDADGSFLRASTLYRWLTGGIRELTRRANWVVQDWTAVPQVAREQIVSLDYRFVNVDACFVNQYRCLYLDEVHTLYPSFASAQPLWFSTHHRSDHLELSLWPAPDRTEPTPALMTSLGPDARVIAVATTEGFLPFGWVRIAQELIQYSELVDAPAGGWPSLQVTRRGVGGTTPALHFAGRTVEHLSVWCRGWRVPSTVTQAQDCVELPMAFQTPLETYLLARVKEAEQDRQGAASLLQEFNSQVDSILNDPKWQQDPWPSQARAYGSYAGGEGLYFGRVVVP